MWLFSSKASPDEEEPLKEKVPKDPADKTAEDIHGKGMHNTHPTDIFCLIIFLAFLGGMGYVGSHAFKNGDPRRLTHGFDYAGRLCGVHPNVSTQPLLYWCSLPPAPLNFAMPTTFNFESPICVTSCPTMLEPGINLLCPMPSATTRTFQPGQVPGTMITNTVIVQQTVSMAPYPTKEVAGRYCLPDVSMDDPIMQTMLNTTGMGKGGQQVLDALGALRRANAVLLASIGVALVLCFAYLLFLKLFARVLIYSALLVLTLSFLAIGAGCLITSFNLTGHQMDSPIFQKYPIDEATLYSQIAGGVSLVMFLITVMLVVCCHSLINTALGCVEAACDCMFQMWELLLQPALDTVVRVTCFFSLLYGGIWVASMGDVHADHDATIGGHKVRGVSRSVQFSEDEQYMVAYYIFGCFWILELANAFGQFTVSYMVVLWYYTRIDEESKKKPRIYCAILKGYAAGLVHLGSLAFGSFLIATCRMVRLILQIVAKQSQASGNPAAACIAKTLLCCVTCFQRFLEFINKNAYIDIAINSNDFCMAAKHSCEFILKDGAEIAFLNGACFIFQFAGVLLVSILTGYTGYLAVTVIHAPYFNPISEVYVSDPQMVFAACGLLGGIISLCFMMVFDQTSDTLLYCFSWNKKNDPAGVHFYAPESLAKLVNKN